MYIAIEYECVCVCTTLLYLYVKRVIIKVKGRDKGRSDRPRQLPATNSQATLGRNTAY